MLPTKNDAHVLIVEDELTTRAAITRALNLMGYHADGVGTGPLAVARLEEETYQVMVLDLRLPGGMDGVEIMRHVERYHPNVLMVILTAEASLESAITALKTGAVDYLRKPVSLTEIENAIARALQRRGEEIKQREFVRQVYQAMQSLQQVSAPPPPPPVGERRTCYGKLCIDYVQRQAHVENQYIDLTAHEFSLLEYLLQYAETVLSCQTLAAGALGYQVSEPEAENIVRPHISRLRKKLDQCDSSAPSIFTVRGRGYVLRNQA